jgi:2-oxoglutarate ferredoxin oxidoreductase subunit gamma
MIERAILAGWGGQGMMMMGKLLAWAAMQEGLEVTYFPSYGAEVRGGTAHCHVVLSSEPIHSPIVETADTLVLMNQESYEKFRRQLRPDGLLLLDASLIEDHEGNAPHVLRIPASAAANELGSVRVANTVMLGAYNAVRRFTPAERMLEAVDHALAGPKAALREINHRAYRRGEEAARGASR